MKALNKTVCINVDCTMWTGRRRLHPEDLGEVAADLPPEDVASMGSLKLCDPSELRGLATIKRRAERACERVAVKFLGGYALDEGNLDGLVDTLSELKAQFDAAAGRIVRQLHGMIDKWVADHPEWEEAIRRCPPDVKRIAKQLRFDFQVIRVSPFVDDETAPAGAGLHRAVEGLTGQLYHEIAVVARTALKRSFEGKTSVGQRAVRVIRAVAEKLDALAYLDGGIRPVLQKVTSVRDAMPKTGEIAGRDLVEVVGLLNLLGNEDQLARFGALNRAALAEDDEDEAEATPVVARPGGAVPKPNGAGTPVPHGGAAVRKPLHF